MTDKPILYTYFFSSPGRAVLLTARTIGLELENRYGFILPAFKLEMIYSFFSLFFINSGIST